MNKKLMAVAVAGALAMPGLALAQSSVTISGFFKVGLENIKLGDFGNNGVRGANPGNNSENRVADNSSRLIFNVAEDLGGGLQAIGQIDNRFVPDTGAISATGNTWVGLRSNSWGALTVGRWDIHYGQNASDIVNKAGALKAASISLLDYVNVKTSAASLATTQAIANATRTPNIIKWQSPNWGGFDMIAAYSTNPVTASGAEADIGTTARKGYGWNINPQFTGSNWQVGYSYWSAKPDASQADQLGQNLFGWYKFGGFKVGASFNKSKLKGGAVGSPQVDVANRDAWSIPVSYTVGPHNILAHYTEARKDKVQDGLGITDTGAKMFAVAYVYDMSKRTSVGLTYAQIKNQQNAAYQLFTDSGTGGALSSNNAAPLAGEDPQLIALIMKHAF